jgi:biopolymer transport protein ExbD
MILLIQKSQHSDIKLELPTASKNPELSGVKSLMISLDNKGNLFLENQSLSKKNLQRELALLKIEQPNLPITIQGDKKVNLGLVIETLDLVKRNGFKNVMIQTSAAEESL